MNGSKSESKNNVCFGINKAGRAVIQDLLKTHNLLRWRPVFIEEKVLNNCKIAAIQSLQLLMHRACLAILLRDVTLLFLLFLNKYQMLFIMAKILALARSSSYVFPASSKAEFFASFRCSLLGKIMTGSLSLKQVVDHFLAHLGTTYSPTQAQRVTNEFLTALYRYVLPLWGLKRKDLQAKMQAAERREAEALLQTLKPTRLPQLLDALEQGFDLAEATKASRSTYGGRIRGFLEWVHAHRYVTDHLQTSPHLPDECRPKMRHGRGDWKDFTLMEDKSRQRQYRLKAADTSPQLQQQLADLNTFLSDLDVADRTFDALADTTVTGYNLNLRLWLGWLLYHNNRTLVPSTLTLEYLVPKITAASLEGLSTQQRKQVWVQAQRALETNINHYFTFLRTQQNADSPRTRLLKLATLLILTKWLYASEVETNADYKTIPIIRTLLNRMEKEQKAVENWEKERQYVADQTRKWPEPPAGQTVLEYAQEALIEVLRLECRPRQSTGALCQGHIIAKSHLLYLVFVDLGILPAGRQQEPCSYQIALSCPIERPSSVPINGVYWPLPPDWARTRRSSDGSVADNYLYKVYHHDGQFYEHGVWVRERCQYKTYRYHGKRVGVIDNIVFADGQCLYDYLERYLCGQWYIASFRDGYRYDWWEAELRGSYGKWLSQGRSELTTDQTPVVTKTGKSEVWVSSHLFLNPSNGQPFKQVQMSNLFARNAYRILGKRVTPHMFRYFWATWAFQMELSDAELASLAHAMGFTVNTMRKMYQRCSPTEKNRPINKAMRKLFLWQVGQKAPPSPTDRFGQLKAELAQLNAAQLLEVRQLLGLDPPA